MIGGQHEHVFRGLSASVLAGGLDADCHRKTFILVPLEGELCLFQGLVLHMLASSSASPFSQTLFPKSIGRNPASIHPILEDEHGEP